MNRKQLSLHIKNSYNSSSINIEEPTKADIYSEDGNVFLDINGVPYLIKINYTGSVFIKKTLAPNFSLDYSSSKLVVINRLRKEIPKPLITFNGNINILDCEILTYSGSLFKASITNTVLESFIQNQETKFDDNTLILREEQRVATSMVNRGGYIGSKLQPNAISSEGKFQFPENISVSDEYKIPTVEKDLIGARQIRATKPLGRRIKKENGVY